MTNERAAPISDEAAEHLIRTFRAGEATSTPPMHSLTEAIERLHQFGYTCKEGQAVGEESWLSADDLAVTIDTLNPISGDVIARDPDD